MKNGPKKAQSSFHSKPISGSKNRIFGYKTDGSETKFIENSVIVGNNLSQKPAFFFCHQCCEKWAEKGTTWFSLKTHFRPKHPTFGDKPMGLRQNISENPGLAGNNLTIKNLDFHLFFPPPKLCKMGRKRHNPVFTQTPFRVKKSDFWGRTDGSETKFIGNPGFGGNNKNISNQDFHFFSATKVMKNGPKC